MWVGVLQTRINLPQNIKAMKGFLWFMCVTQESELYCKTLIDENVDLIYSEIFNLMLSPTMVCGYLFDLCETSHYELLSTKAYQNITLIDKPELVANNSFLDMLYQKSNPSTFPPTFRVLFFSDFEIDMQYVTNSSISGGCHGNTTDVGDADKAPRNGTKKCNMPIEGFKRMIDVLNEYNTTTYLSFDSIIYAGGTNAYVPGYVNETNVNEAHAEAIKYMREKNPLKGIYYSLG